MPGCRRRRGRRDPPLPSPRAAMAHPWMHARACFAPTAAAGGSTPLPVAGACAARLQAQLDCLPRLAEALAALSNVRMRPATRMVTLTSSPWLRARAVRRGSSAPGQLVQSVRHVQVPRAQLTVAHAETLSCALFAAEHGMSARGAAMAPDTAALQQSVHGGALKLLGAAVGAVEQAQPSSACAWRAHCRHRPRGEEA